MDKVKRPESIKFYILFPGDTEEDCEKEVNQVGIETYQRKYTDKEKNFYHIESVFIKLDGYRLLEKLIISERLDILKNTKIFSSKGKQFSIEQLFDRINKSKVVK